jgi:hypothetical protein
MHWDSRILLLQEPNRHHHSPMVQLTSYQPIIITLEIQEEKLRRQLISRKRWLARVLLRRGKGFEINLR